jgi:tetraacyldisaccharide-1-P 4'-kinase
VEDLGTKVAGFHAFKDHQAYDSDSVAQVASRARQCGVDTIVMTQKDAVKLEEEWLKSQEDVRWFFLRIEQKIVSGEGAYRQALAGLFPGDR